MVVLLAVVMGGAFITVVVSFIGYFILQHRVARQTVAQGLALEIAEAGINYYRWHLAHQPNDYTDGTGSPGPYVHPYLDPEGGQIGSFSLAITQPPAGSSLVVIESTGWSDRFPNVKRKIRVRYGIPSVAQYSFLSDSSSWYGAGLTVGGRIHSNNGIRMDGTNLSTVASYRTSYTCGSETGCSPPATRPGVWGAGGPSGLWQFPVPRIDFDTITGDLVTMRSAAIADSTHFTASGSGGYHLVFRDTGVLDVYRVTQTATRRGYDTGVCHTLNERINTEQFVGQYALAAHPIFFFEDNVWVEGTVRGRTTVVAAHYPFASANTTLWVRNNVVYSVKDGSDVLGLISKDDIQYVLDLPNNFEIDAALLAQRGRIVRYHYNVSSCQTYTNAVRNSLTIHGALMTKLKSYWNFGSGPSSGFTTRTVNYDSSLFYSPPPYFPTSGEYQFISWEER